MLNLCLQQSRLEVFVVLPLHPSRLLGLFLSSSFLVEMVDTLPARHPHPVMEEEALPVAVEVAVAAVEVVAPRNSS
jgi:hypothetical protein